MRPRNPLREPSMHFFVHKTEYIIYDYIMRVEDRYPVNTDRNSLANRDWAAGSSVPLQHREFIFADGAITRKKLVYPPSLYKVIDEPIVNALDHMVNYAETTRRVTRIDIVVDEVTGRVSITNDGPGIQSDWHSGDGANMHTPQFIFGVVFQGSNTDKPGDSITGGTNGIGAKVANCYSSEFIIETVEEGKKYYQRWSDRMTNVEPPIITDTREPTFTRLTFTPDFVGHFKYSAASEVLPAFVELSRTRALFAALYANHTNSRTIVTFNGEEMRAGKPANIAAMMFPTAAERSFNIQIPGKYPWDFNIVVGEGRGAICNVNGIVTIGGSHINYIIRKLIAPVVKKHAIKSLGDKKVSITTDSIAQHLFIVGNMQVPNPGWSSQRKDVLQQQDSYFSHITITPKIMTTIADLLMPLLFKPKRVATKKKTKLTDIEKYHPAEKAGSKSAADCSLILVEGDSAMSQAVTGISTNKELSFDYYGIMSTGGVIMNARNEVKMIGGMLRPTTKLKSNIFMSNLLRVTGLEYETKYAPGSATYKQEIGRLRYGQIIACVDQDLDGVGNIFGLLLNNFEVLWPNLLAAGYIKRFATPIIRAYPRSAGYIEDFYADPDYRKWARINDETKYEIKYYKGLGSHSRDETVSMFKRFKEHLYTYTTSPRTAHTFVSFYDDGYADERKEILRSPLITPSAETIKQQQRDMSVMCEDHLQYETKMFQLDNIERHLLHIIDGHSQSGRKIYDGSLKAFDNSNERRKVAQLAGYIAEHENYHHGEASLGDSVRAKAFTFLGAEQVPYLVPLSSFGTRMYGGKDAGSVRYIFTKFNKRVWDIICPAEDYQLLDFHFDEGARGEPKYFIPIIPTVLLNNYETLGHGWSIKIWARDVLDIIANVRTMVTWGSSNAAFYYKMNPNTYGFKGEIKRCGNSYASFGTYEIISSTVIRITELPLRVWTKVYIEKTLKVRLNEYPQIFDSYIDRSDDLNVDIYIKLKPEGLNALHAAVDGGDAIIEMLKLRKSMISLINLMAPDGRVLTLDAYEDVFPIWFPVRREQYARRIEHQRRLLEIRIDVAEQKLRYASHATLFSERRARDMTVPEMETLLASHNYKRINKTNLGAIKFVPTADLHEHVFGCKKVNYNYLIDDITDRMRSSDGIAKLGADLDKLKDKLAALNEMAAQGRFPGASIWLSELDRLKDAIEEGRRTNWLYGESGKFKFK